MNVTLVSFKEKLHECTQHKIRLETSSSILKPLMPLTVATFETLSDTQMSFIDQMVFRFSKLQDTMGEKLFPYYLLLQEEEVKSKSFIDRLNRLEELGLLKRDEWLLLRKDRNEIAHEYSFNRQEVVDSINAVYYAQKKLLALYETFYLHAHEKFSL